MRSLMWSNALPEMAGGNNRGGGGGGGRGDSSMALETVLNYVKGSFECVSQLGKFG